MQLCTSSSMNVIVRYTTPSSIFMEIHTFFGFLMGLPYHFTSLTLDSNRRKVKSRGDLSYFGMIRCVERGNRWELIFSCCVSKMKSLPSSDEHLCNWWYSPSSSSSAACKLSISWRFFLAHQFFLHFFLILNLGVGTTSISCHHLDFHSTSTQCRIWVLTLFGRRLSLLEGTLCSLHVFGGMQADIFFRRLYADVFPIWSFQWSSFDSIYPCGSCLWHPSHLVQIFKIFKQEKELR